MEVVAEKKKIKPVKKTKKVPKNLIREIMDGVPFYYKGYREVLNKTKTFEEIRGCSGLQSVIVSYLLTVLLTKVDTKKYWVLSNELGNHLDHRNNLSYDLAIFEKSVLTADKINTKYVDVPPHTVIEVDVKVDLKETGFSTLEDFIFVKTDKVFSFGAKKLLWILSRPKKVIVAENGKPWKVHNWDEDLQFMEGIPFNVANYLHEEGIDSDV